MILMMLVFFRPISKNKWIAFVLITIAGASNRWVCMSVYQVLQVTKKNLPSGPTDGPGICATFVKELQVYICFT